MKLKRWEFWFSCKDIGNPMKNPWQIHGKILNLQPTAFHEPIRTRVAILETRSGPGVETMDGKGGGWGRWQPVLGDWICKILGRFRMICVKNLSRTNFLFDHQWVSPEYRSLNSESVVRGCWTSQVFALHYSCLIFPTSKHVEEKLTTSYHHKPLQGKQFSIKHGRTFYWNHSRNSICS